MSGNTGQANVSQSNTSPGNTTQASVGTTTTVQAPSAAGTTTGGIVQTSVVSTTGGHQTSAVTGGLQAVGTGAAQPGQFGVPLANPVIPRKKPLGSSKPPKFDDTFEVYQMRLKLYLEQRDSWGVVTGDEQRPAADPVLQREFDDRDRLAMETIIRGVKGADAQKVCTFGTAKEMWDSLTAEKTQRDFSYAVHLQREMFTHSYAPGQKMADYIQEMNSLRQRLQHMGTAFTVDDTFMSQLLLMGVCAVHREIVTQFDFSYRQGNPPTLQQVKNALLSRDEMDKMAADTAVNSGSNDKQSVSMHMGQQSGGTKNTGSGQSSGQMQTAGSAKKRKIRCYHCKKLGHMRRDCWHYKNKQAKATDKKDTTQGKTKGSGNKSDATESKGSKPTTGAAGYMRFVSRAGDESSSSSDSDEFVGMAMKGDRHGKCGDWMLDSGTTAHVCTERELFTRFKKSKSSFKVWDGGVTHGHLCGSVVVTALDNASKTEMTFVLNDVEFSPQGPVNLISLGLLLKEGWTLTTSRPNELPRKMFLTQDGKCLEFIFHGAHYWLNNGSFGETEAVVMTSVSGDASPLMKWHERLAHLNEAALKFMIKNNVVTGMKISSEQLKTKLCCHSCMAAKPKRMSFGDATKKRTTKSFERLTSDVCDMGKYLPGIGAVRYFQLVHDEGSRYKWCFPLKHKSEAAGNTQRLIAELLAQKKTIVTFTSDGGGEYVNNELKTFLQKHGIVFIPTHPYTPQENCLVEKMNGVLVNKMRAVMHAANLPMVLWPEVLSYVVDVDNLSPTKALKGMTPTEKLTGLKPNISKLKVCGCVGYVFVPKEVRQNKLSAKAEPALLLGFPSTSHGYRLLHLRTGKIVESRDVKFREDVTVDRTYINALLKGRQHYYPQIPFVPLPVEYVAEQEARSRAGEVVQRSIDRLRDDGKLQTECEEVVQKEQPGGGADSVGVGAAEDICSDDENDSVGSAGMSSGNIAMPAPNRLSHAHEPHLKDSAASEVPETCPNEKHASRRSQRVKKANVRLKDYAMASLDTMENLAGNLASVEEAMASIHRKQWEKAMRLEMEAHSVNGTWRLVDRPKAPCNILKTTWVLRPKLNEKGHVDRLKARLAVKGCGQKYGVDYVETYSPVVRIETVRFLLIMAFLLDYDCVHVDFVTAFLNGELEGVKIFMEQPDYFHDGTDRICELLKGLYGLKQASRLWYKTLHDYLMKLGFKQCSFDVGLYQRWQNGRVVYVTVYVDDLLIAGKKEDIEGAIDELSQRFALKNLGRVKHLLAMEVHYIPGKILCLSQTAYIDRVLKRFGMSDARPIGSPQMQNERMPSRETDVNKINDPMIPFRELIGALQYLVACTRPDLANAVRTLARYSSAYTKENYECAKRILRYLSATRTYGLVYRKQNPVLPLQIDGYCDADHANCPDTSRSVSGYLLRLNGCMFLYKSKQQSKVTTDTCSSELIAASTCVEDLMWARKLLKETSGKKPPCSILRMDNQSTLAVVKEPGNYQRMKRFAKTSRKIAEFVAKRSIEVQYISGEHNIADIFTKALGTQRFQGLRQALNVEDVSEALQVQHE